MKTLFLIGGFGSIILGMVIGSVELFVAGAVGYMLGHMWPYTKQSK